MKLEDIPKKDIFDVPEGYFEKLPGVIQARVAKPSRQPSFRLTLAYALPVVAVLAFGIYWFIGTEHPASVETALMEIPTQELVAYLTSTEMSTDELLDAAMLDSDDASEIENEVYQFDLNDEHANTLLEEMDL